MSWVIDSTSRNGRRNRRGLALIPALIVTSMVAMMGLAMLMANLSGARVVNFQNDEYTLTSAVESVGILATERLWTDYLADQNGAAGDIASFRSFLDDAGILDSGAGGAPGADEGVDLLEEAGIPGAAQQDAEFDDVNVNALRVLRRDEGEATRLYVTVSASTNRGQGIVNPVLNRAIQMVYTVEPEQYEGFEYGVLANNVNCIFCHTQIDSVERYYNTDPEAYGNFESIKVGTLESMMIRDNGDGHPSISDWDSDSFIAGTLYVRGPATDHDGLPIQDWSDQTFKSFQFDEDGNLLEDDWGELTVADFVPAGDPPQAGENLYLNYPTEASEMPDAQLPNTFPPPFPDDGGIDPATGEPDPTGAGNRVVDPHEFFATSQSAEGAIVAGVINVTDHSFIIDTIPEYSSALMSGNRPSLPPSTTGNVVLSGTVDNPIVIDGTVAIEGDVVINGYIKGEGTIVASGSIYVPTDLQYLDGNQYLEGDPPGYPSGPRTFGIAEDGTKNALGLACGGNILLGDYLKPAYWMYPGQTEIITGDASGEWNFALAELSLFNRGEWAKTQPVLPGQNEDALDPSSWTVVNPNNHTHALLPAPGEDPQDPATWTMQNPNFEEGWIPRYYNFGPNDEIPVYNKGELWFDGTTSTWRGDEEVPIDWDPALLSMWDPNDTSNSALFEDGTGAPVAAILQLTPSGGWLDDHLQKLAIEYFESNHPMDTPMAVDGLLYTNNAIFGIVHRNDRMRGQLRLNGALVCADLGVLTPGRYYPAGQGTSSNPPGSPYKIGLQLNYDRRIKDMLNVTNTNQVVIKRTLWNPTANML